MFKELIAKLFIVKVGCGKFAAAAALHKFIRHKVAGTLATGRHGLGGKTAASDTSCCDKNPGKSIDDHQIQGLQNQCQCCFE